MLDYFIGVNSEMFVTGSGVITSWEVNNDKFEKIDEMKVDGN